MKTEYKNIDKIGTTWEHHDSEYNDYYINSMSNVVEGMLRSEPTANRTLLDVGCGEGGWMRTFKHFPFYKVYGIDISQERINKAKEKGYIGSVGDATKLSFKDNSLGFVSCLGVFVHIEDIKRREQAMKEMHRVLKRGGCCILGITNDAFYNNLKALVGEDIGDKGFSFPENIWHIKDFCKSVGFEVEEIKGVQYDYFTFMGNNRLIRRVLDTINYYPLAKMVFFKLRKVDR